jgi:hypothetical protein
MGAEMKSPIPGVAKPEPEGSSNRSAKPLQVCSKNVFEQEIVNGLSKAQESFLADRHLWRINNLPRLMLSSAQTVHFRSCDCG